MKQWITVSDMIAAVAAAFVALPYVTPQHLPAYERFALLFATLIGFGLGWHFAKERHWILKIFLYIGMMLLSLTLVDLAVEIVTRL